MARVTFRFSNFDQVNGFLNALHFLGISKVSPVQVVAAKKEVSIEHGDTPKPTVVDYRIKAVDEEER